MTTANGEHINIQKKHHEYRKKTQKHIELVTVKKTTYKKGPFV